MMHITPRSKLVIRNQALLSAFQTKNRRASTLSTPAGTPCSRAPESSPDAPRRALATTTTIPTAESTDMMSPITPIDLDTVIPEPAISEKTTSTSDELELPSLPESFLVTRHAMSFGIPKIVPSLAKKALAEVVFGQGRKGLTPDSPWYPNNLALLGDREASRVASQVILLALQMLENTRKPGQKTLNMSQLSSAMTTNKIMYEWAREVGLVQELERKGGMSEGQIKTISIKKLADHFETFLGALHVDQGTAGPDYFLAPLFVREYNRLLGVNLLLDGACSERSPRAFKAWIPNAISLEDYKHMQGVLEASNRTTGETDRLNTKRTDESTATASSPTSVPSKPLFPSKPSATVKTSGPVSKTPKSNKSKKPSIHTPPSASSLKKKAKANEPKSTLQPQVTPKKPTMRKLPQIKPKKVSVVMAKASVVEARAIPTTAVQSGKKGRGARAKAK
ncbi:BZ3501_MvSof-1269-A2-R1_Chr12-1g03314 [Microbotryum saponariae]|nr:BZ3501_MvSof-1269-A2-R1_Chr12-1g03314 [Microbotryum saponariae]